MSQRDSGWIQLYAESNQEALDLHIQAFRLAEELSLPGDGVHGRLHPHPRLRARRHARRRRTSTRSCRRSSRARCSTRPTPLTIGAMVGPEAFSEVRYLMHAKQMQALDLDSEDRRGVRERASGATPAAFSAATDAEDAETIVVALGSVLGTIEDVVDELRERGVSDRRARDEVVPAVPARGGARGARARKRVVVIEKAFAVGVGGIVSAERAASRCRASPPPCTR